MKLEDYKKRILEDLNIVNKKMDLLNKEIKDLTKHLDLKDRHIMYELQSKNYSLINLDIKSENLINLLMDLNKIENE